MPSTQTLTTTPPSSSASQAIVKAWLIAGTLDILAAFISFYVKTGKSPVRVLEFVASGVFGKSAFGGDSLYAVAGLLFHYCIAGIFAIVFYYVWPVFRLLVKNRIVMGLIYGIFVWLVMNLVIVPLSNTPKSPFNWSGAIQGCLILMVCIGLPISWIVGKYRERRAL